MTDLRRERGTTDQETPGRRRGDREIHAFPADRPLAAPSLRSAGVFAAAAALLAIFLRVPVCGESLWVDELHSAWAVWGEWQEVAFRAAWGNQTPWYFYVLWGWRHFAGDSELALRMPSVVATALASAVLVVGVARNGGGLLGGVIAGLLLAADRNAIFFGTEARPYAGTILAVAVAAWCGAELRSAELRSAELRSAELRSAELRKAQLSGAHLHGAQRRTSRHSGGRYTAGWGVWGARAGILLACFGGFLIHATAAIPLAVVATTLFGWPRRFGELRDAGTRGFVRGRSWWGLFRPQPFSAVVYLAVVAGMALVLWINADAIFRVWSDRSQWNAFGRPRSFRELWTIWPWTWLVLVPWGFWAVVTFGSGGGRGHWQRERAEPTDPILAAAVLTTAAAWAVSCWDIAPIWHRRFMVGVLPLLCWAAGGYWGAGTMRVIERLRRPSPHASPTAAAAAKIALAGLVAMVAVGGLMFGQGTLAELLAGERVLVHRGENWRAAVAYLAEHRRPSDPAFVAAELLESSALDSLPVASPEPSPGLVEYLRYPVSGPYRVDRAIPLGRQFEPVRRTIVEAARGGERVSEPSCVWILLRRSEPQTRAILRSGRLSSEELEPLVDSVETHGFGGVTLVRIGVARGG